MSQFVLLAIQLEKALERHRESSVDGLRAVRAEVERFPRSSLRHVEPVVKIILPSLEGGPP